MKKSTKLIIVAIILLISVSACLITFLILNGGKEVKAKSKLVFLDLDSKGNATLVQSVDSKGNPIYGIIDGGKHINFSKDIVPYLTENNIKRLDFLIVTHMDVDHVGGIEELLDSEYVDKDTTLYMKITSKSKVLYNTVKNKGMNLAVVEPITRPENIKTNKEVMDALDSVFLTKINYYSKADDYTKATESNNFSFGEFTIIIYNGLDWNAQDVVDEDWDENVNSLTCLLERNNSKNELQRIYIGSDLGENSAENSTEDHVQYSMVIAERISQIVGQVDVYLVAHHGYYFSMNEATAKNLNFQYAIVTNSYDEIAFKAIKKFKKKYPDLNDTEALDIGTNTLKALCASERLKNIFFTDGENYGMKTTYEIIQECQPSSGYVLTDDKGYIRKGNVIVDLASDINIHQ